MKAILEFQLPKERPDFLAAIHGPQARAALWEIAQYCRGVLKHGEPSEELARHMHLIRDMISEELLYD
jgi:hypothetical protein